MAEQVSLKEFADKIRERRPDLANIPDVTLVAKTLAAAPELKQYVDIGNLPGMNAIAKAVPDSRTSTEVMQDQAANVLRGIPQAVTGIPSVVGALMKAGLQGNPLERDRQLGELAVGAAQPATTAVKGAVSGRNVPLPGLTGSVQFPEFPEGDPSNPAWTQAAQGAGASLGAAELPNALGTAAGAVSHVLPNANRAGAMFEQIMGKAKNEPINTAAADAIAARAQELRARGSTLPKVLNDYLKAQKTGVPMTYEAGRDFATNAGALSARETTAMNAKMQSQVAQFAKALKEANREAAANVGMGDLYDKAITEYRQAKTLQDAGEVVKKWAVPAALTALGIHAAYDIYSKVRGN